jgi:hypothetical protein
MSLLVRLSTDPGALLVRDTDDPLALAVTESTSPLALRVRESTSPLAQRVRGLLDPDAKAFIDLTGATDRAGINAFVRGVKALGLWDSMVCWPLRSSQNAGSGTTAFSLGGLGTFNGTLVNGPTWGVDGVVFVSGSARVITLPSVPLVGDYMQASTQAAPSGNLRVLNFVDTGAAVGLWAGFANNYYWDGRASVGGSVVRLIGGTVGTAMQFNLGTATTAGMQFFVNGSSIMSNATSTALSSTAKTSFQINDNGGNGTIAFVLMAQSVTGASSLYALYKSTLGIGLGLP